VIAALGFVAIGFLIGSLAPPSRLKRDSDEQPRVALRLALPET
jgi:hypothetical protein